MSHNDDSIWALEPAPDALTILLNEEKKRNRLRNELYGAWLSESEEERKLRELAETYHTGCETYDRRVCSGTSPRIGDAMPVTPHEMGLINRHAREMRDTIIAEGWKLGFSREQVEQATRKYSR